MMSGKHMGNARRYVWVASNGRVRGEHFVEESKSCAWWKHCRRFEGTDVKWLLQRSNNGIRLNRVRAYRTQSHHSFIDR